MDNLSQQMEEIGALAAIYGDDWQIHDIVSRTYSIRIPDGDNYVILYLKLNEDYPSRLAPDCEISAPHLDCAAKRHLNGLLDSVHAEIPGEPLIYQWIERIREELPLGTGPEGTTIDDDDGNVEAATIPIEISSTDATNPEGCPVINHGEVIVDRKSSFQGHAATIRSVDGVNRVLKSLLSNRKIEHATHNIYAYRIFKEDEKIFVQDFDDDGEAQAGGRLLHLLQIMDARNVLVVVTRWYGGVHLGPDRFRHINNAARQVLQDSQLIAKQRPRKK